MLEALTTLTGGGALKGGDAGPSSASSRTDNRFGFDNSGWAVNFAPGGSASATPTGQPFDWQKVAMIAGAVGLVWLIATRPRRK